ncbi:hypothetical protein MUBE_13925, partial [Mycobacterium uberis]
QKRRLSPAFPSLRPPTQLVPPHHGYHPIRRNTSGKTYYLRKPASSKNHNETMYYLKQQLSDTIYRPLRNDTNTTT